MRKSFKALLALFFSLVIFLSFRGLSRAEEKEKTHKILYYRSPMNPAITSKVPAKDPMGMDYIPVYEEKQDKSPAQEMQGIIKLSSQDIALAGIKSETVISRHLFKEIRTVGKVAYDPELYKAQEEFVQAIKTQKALETSDIKGQAQSLREAAGLKLRLLGLSDGQIDELSKQNQPDRSLIISDKENPYVWLYTDMNTS